MSYENKPDIWPERDFEEERKELEKLLDSGHFRELVEARWYPLPFFRTVGLTQLLIEKQAKVISTSILPSGERIKLDDGREVISTGEVIYKREWRSFFIKVSVSGETEEVNLKQVDDIHLPGHLKSANIPR